MTYDISKLNNRSINIDIVKALAVFCVVCVHFFLNSGFYNDDIERLMGFFGVSLRTALMVCVPLFLISTGYLMKNKTLAKSYYFGVIKTILIYLIVSGLCLVWRMIYFHQEYSIVRALFAIFDFTACSYSWYVEMYLGLFFLIPFLNTLYNGLTSKSSRLALLATLFFVVAIPPFLNVNHKILPEWWSSTLYPLLYYYIGAYLRDYPIKVPVKTLTFILICWVIASSFINQYVSVFLEGGTFLRSGFTSWQSFVNVITSTCLFALIMQLDFSNLSKVPRFCIYKIASSTLGIYLVSWIIDKTTYPFLMDSIGSFYSLFPWFLPVVIFNFAASCLLGILISMVVDWLCSFIFARTFMSHQ